MSRRSSDASIVQQGEKIEISSNNDVDSSREVVIDDHHNPSPVVSNGISKDAIPPPPPPPLLLASTPIKANGMNGDNTNSKTQSHKCSGCGFIADHLPDLLEHNKNCPSTNPDKPSQPKPNTGQLVGSKCTMCTQVFANLESQIKHMTDFHKLKASFKCSFCRMSFNSKELIEAHIKTHANKASGSKTDKVDKPIVEKKEEKVLEPIVNDDNDDSITNELAESVEDVDCLVCGKSFKDPVQHRDHEAKCTGPENTQNLGDEMEDFPEYFAHFKHDHINLVTDPDNPYCRGCEKTMGSVLGICNHLSRRHDCREWYCRNLSKEIKKADQLRKAQGVPRPEPLPTRQRGQYARRSNASQSSHSNSPLMISEEQPTPKRQASLLAQTHMKVASKGQIVEGYDDKTRSAPKPIVTLTPSNKRPDGPHSIQCTNCNKVFDGRSPHVGFTNHQRGSQDCRENGTRRFITTKSGLAIKSATPSPIPTKSRRRESPTIELDDDDTKSGTQYFYCKLCDDGDPKTRTSLGCHLTVHHGLPPVNTKNAGQDAFRCQTCCQMFNSKHYYNQHRHDCDLQSAYVGFCDNNAKPGPKRPRGRSSAPAAVSMTVQRSGGNNLSCELCGKSGFAGPNAVRIHTKYICVNRAKVDPNAPNKGGFLSLPKVPKLRIKTSAITQSPMVVEGRSTRYRDSIPQNSSVSESSGNELKRSRADSLKCNDCGRGPYTNVHHLMEHQRNYCRALKRNSNQNGKRETLQDDIDQIRSTRSAKRFANERADASLDESSPDVEVDMKDISSQDIECSVCGMMFAGMEKFIKHRLNHIDDVEDMVEPMKCEVCLAKVFSCFNIEEFNQHLESHMNKTSDSKVNGSKMGMPQSKSKIQDVLQRSLTCSICNQQSEGYDQKVSHERKCREKFMKILTCSICGHQSESYDQKVKHERKCLDSFMTSDGFDGDDGAGVPKKNGENGSDVAEDIFAHLDTDDKRMDNLRKLFGQLLDVLDIKSEDELAEDDCRRILINLGEEPVGETGSSDLDTFRSNVASFLRLMIRSDTLERAYEEVGTVDEALFNLLQNPLKSELQ